jgi:hypothetical protein
MNFEFTLFSILKALTEVAGFALLGQGTLYLFAGARRESNFAYLMLKAVTSPVFKLARFLSPRVVLDRHIWILTPLIVIVLWVTFTYMKIKTFVEAGSGAAL